MAKELRRGDRVEWNFGRGKAIGTVRRKLDRADDDRRSEGGGLAEGPALRRDNGAFQQGGGQEGRDPAQDRSAPKAGKLAEAHAQAHHVARGQHAHLNQVTELVHEPEAAPAGPVRGWTPASGQRFLDPAGVA